jgi:hypothetical protein
MESEGRWKARREDINVAPSYMHYCKTLCNNKTLSCQINKKESNGGTKLLKKLEEIA